VSNSSQHDLPHGLFGAPHMPSRSGVAFTKGCSARRSSRQLAECMFDWKEEYVLGWVSTVYEMKDLHFNYEMEIYIARRYFGNKGGETQA
jgi:hypothetical protein